MFEYNDGGRSTSKRPRQDNDCTVRAIALTCGLPYDESYDLLKQAGRKSHDGFDLASFIKKQKTINGKQFTWQSFPAVKGQPRMNTRSFIEKFPDGAYILSQAKHVSVVINGVNHDLVTTWERCVYGVWLVQ